MIDRLDEPSMTAPPAHEPYSPQRRTALVLTGTGTAGAYHAGVLRALHEAGVKLDMVAGRGLCVASWAPAVAWRLPRAGLRAGAAHGRWAPSGGARCGRRSPRIARSNAAGA